MNEATQGAWIPMTAALATFVLGISVGAVRHGDSTRWLGWAGEVVTAVLVVNTWLGMGSPVVLGFSWVLALAVVMAISLPTSGSLPEGSVNPSLWIAVPPPNARSASGLPMSTTWSGPSVSLGTCPTT